MKITFPHMGYLYLPLAKLLQAVDLEVVIPPPTSKRTLTLGTRYAPEFVCLPFKLTLGNFIEALEQGADTILMAEGPGRCRFGFYGQVQAKILTDLGFDFTMLPVNISEKVLLNLLTTLRKAAPHKTWWDITGAVRLGLCMLQALDELERELYRIRPRECQRGESTAVHKRIIAELEQAASISEIREMKAKGLARLRAVPQDPGIKPLRVGLLGEFYVVLEPFATGEIERRLGEMGVEVAKFFYSGEWAVYHLFIKLLRMVSEHKDAAAAARPYLPYHVGGDGQQTVGQAVLCAREGYDGVIQLYPFTCMPEIVAQYMLPRIQDDYGLPVMVLGVDEHTGEAGMVTRLEAFVDFLQRKRAMTGMRKV